MESAQAVHAAADSGRATCCHRVRPARWP
jgi:hypothetical protein